MTSSTKANWLVPSTLIALSAVPVVAGAVRLVGLAGGAEITPDNARFFAVPFFGLLPLLRIFTTRELEDSLTNTGFHIDHQWQPEKGKAVFIVAKKA